MKRHANAHELLTRIVTTEQRQVHGRAKLRKQQGIEALLSHVTDTRDSLFSKTLPYRMTGNGTQLLPLQGLDV